MNCLECTRTNESRQPCDDVLSLFCALRVPRREQIILWEMAVRETDCSSLRNILCLLQTIVS
ncbi:MAG: hypothetical protein LBR10_08750 [Prevotellaceae bacterium]|jgi:hypothetical protein|nr:hypothetical protein [Prevotellaceae bacterium]